MSAHHFLSAIGGIGRAQGDAEYFAALGSAHGTPTNATYDALGALYADENPSGAAYAGLTYRQKENGDYTRARNDYNLFLDTKVNTLIATNGKVKMDGVVYTRPLPHKND